MIAPALPPATRAEMVAELDDQELRLLNDLAMVRREREELGGVKAPTTFDLETDLGKVLLTLPAGYEGATVAEWAELAGVVEAAIEDARRGRVI